MLISIDKNHPIFNNPEYLKDIVPFNLIEIIKYNPMLLVSNEKNVIIGMSAPTPPVWIWTSDDITDIDISELCDYFYNNFQDKKPINFVAKPYIAKVLSDMFIKDKNVSYKSVNMESFECKTLIPAKNNNGNITRPNADDIDEIATCISGFFVDCFGEFITNEESIEEAKHFIDKPKSFVLKLDENIASIACSTRETETHIAINHVYTKPEYRGQGFAAAIVAYICKLIFENGKIPLLYTDLSNPSSNKAYKNIGFTECGKVDEITLHWSDINV